jgi:hypothetical protein
MGINEDPGMSNSCDSSCDSGSSRSQDSSNTEDTSSTGSELDFPPRVREKYRQFVRSIAKNYPVPYGWWTKSFVYCTSSRACRLPMCYWVLDFTQWRGLRLLTMPITVNLFYC